MQKDNMIFLLAASIFLALAAKSINDLHDIQKKVFYGESIQVRGQKFSCKKD